MFIAARLAALAIGLVPGAVSGTPSLITQLAQGVYFAACRRSTWEALELSEEVRGGGWCWDVLGYSFLCPLLVLEDAEITDRALGRKLPSGLFGPRREVSLVAVAVAVEEGLPAGLPPAGP